MASHKSLRIAVIFCMAWSVLGALPQSASAACTSPDGIAGGITWNGTDSVIWCNGTVWFALKDAATGAAGSTGQLQFNNGSNAFAADSNLTWDNSNKRLGIGNAAPSYMLHLGNVAGASAGTLAISAHNGASGFRTTVFKYDASWNFGLYDQGTTRQFSVNYHAPADSLYLGETGVGIGTTNPASMLVVDKSANALGNTALASNYLVYLRNYSTTSGQGAGLAFAVDTNASSANIGGAIIFKRTTTASQGELQFYTKQTTTSGAAPAQAMVITDTGSVGIGTTSATAKLQVAGAMVSIPGNVASGAAVDLSASNTVTLAAVGGSVIALSNMVHGGNYTLVVQDTTSRTYTFSGCNTSKFRPANASTTAGSQTIYNILTIYNGATYDCYITWTAGYQ